MDYIGSEPLIEVNGKRYRLGRFTRKVLKQFLSWADEELGNPLEQVKGQLAGFPEHIQEIMVRDAIDRAKLRRSINSPEVQALLTTPEGAMKILALLFQQHQPALSDRDVERIYDECCDQHGPGYLEKKIAAAGGTIPRDEEAIIEGRLLGRDESPKG
jgi:hypothetical protein